MAKKQKLTSIVAANTLLEQAEKRVAALKKMISGERDKVAGYEQIAKVHSAYIAILLQRLGATKDNMIAITAEEVKEAMSKCEARAMPTEEGFSLYCEVIE